MSMNYHGISKVIKGLNKRVEAPISVALKDVRFGEVKAQKKDVRKSFKYAAKALRYATQYYTYPDRGLILEGMAEKAATLAIQCGKRPAALKILSKVLEEENLGKGVRDRLCFVLNRVKAAAETPQ